MSTEFSAFKQDIGLTVTEWLLTVLEEREGIDLLDVDQRLYDVIDPDALNALFNSDTFRGCVEFTYLEYEVCIQSGGEINLTPVAD